MRDTLNKLTKAFEELLAASEKQLDQSPTHEGLQNVTLLANARNALRVSALMTELKEAEKDFNSAGGRGVELAERIDELRALTQ